jgi:GNAT superfamily N-acetyltransferase
LIGGAVRVGFAAMEVRDPEPGDVAAVVALAASVIGERRADPLIRAHLGRRELLVAACDGAVAGLLAYRTDWFQCTFISLVVVAEHLRRCGVARTLFHEAERRSPSARVFSSTEETNAIAIQMHRVLGFTPSGHIDNLPQGYRELLFYKRLQR